MSSQRGGVPPFRVMRVIDAVGRRRAAGLPVVDLSAGQPSTPAPATVRAAAHRALDVGRLGYTGALGVPALREAIAAHYRDRGGVDVDPANVVVTTGSSGGFLLSFLAAFDVGDTVVMARPGYPAYRNMLASPANPTGTMVAPEDLRDLAQWCSTCGTRLISDEIYHGITFGEVATSAWQTDHESVVVNSFSKYFSMTGWRIGWLLVPDELLDSVDRLAGNFTICPPALSQLAAVAAFDAYDELDANVARYADNRLRLLAQLRSIGLTRLAPSDGAFYVYADVSQWTSDSEAWCAGVLDETGVALVPGVDFDPVDGGRFVRMCFAGDGAEIERGIDDFGRWLARQ